MSSRINVAILFACLVALAQPAAAQAPSTDDLLASQIKDLMSEKLDVSVEPSTLFRLDLVAEADTAAALLDKIRSPKSAVEAEGASELWKARAAFFALPVKRQRQLLEAHRARQAASAEEAAKKLESEQAIEQLETATSQLEAFLAGELALEVDPNDILVLDLLAPGGAALSPARLTRLLGEPSPASARVAGADLEAAREKFDAALARYLRLTAEDRQRLLEVHQKRRAEAAAEAREAAEATTKAEEVAKAQEDALAAAAAAESEGARLLEEERARLLAVRQGQETVRQLLADRQEKLDAKRDDALRWSRRVSNAIKAKASAEREYDELVVVLKQERALLGDALDDLAESRSEVPPIDEPPPITVPDHIDDSTLAPLQDEIRAQDDKLRTLEKTLRWEITTTLHATVVAMNKDRLRLLPHLPEQRRGELLGFGPAGIAQAGRELGQIVLEVRFRAHAFPRSLATIRSELRQRPLDTALMVVKLMVVVLAFRTWRKRSTQLLAGWRRAWLARRPQTRGVLAVVGVIGYAQRVRHPLEWLAFLWLLGWLLPDVAEFPELDLVWTVVVWCLVGAFVIRLIDAMAARQTTKGQDETAALRYRSLRMVGVIVVVLGLLLSLTESLVGQGAVYIWAWRLCWLVALPVLLLLFIWWRPIIFARAEKHTNPNRFLRWALAHDRGVWSVPATVVGGLALLGEGIARWAVMQASALAVTRRLLAHLFRREVEKQAAVVDESQFQPLAPDVSARLDEAEKTLLVDEIEAKNVTRISGLVQQHNNLLIAVVGERGRGKSRFIERVYSSVEPSGAVRVRCEPGGFDSFVADLASALGLEPSSSSEDVLDTLTTQPPDVIFIDDAHRLIKPLIGGLRGIDRLVEFAHRAAESTSWVVAIAAPAWQYLRRARGDRALFDDVVTLEPWNEESILALTRGLAETAELSPRFDELVVPRQMIDTQYSEAERSERDYCRILWDYSDGNALVASFYFRESLAMKDGACVVRLFKTPSLAGLEGAPGSMHFVLRAIVQLDLATEHDIIQCTDLQPAEVADALRVAKARGYVERNDGYLRVTTRWYRAVVRFLKRQHLLVA